jgi:hypothetical protein
LIHSTNGETTYEHDNGEISKVKLGFAGLGKRNIRIANLPPELPNEAIRSYLSKYGTIQNIADEKWSNTYRYSVGNGIRIVTMDLKVHVPSHLYIDGYRALISYTGQPVTCYVCNATDHIAQECHKRRPKRTDTRPPTKQTWAHIVDKRAQNDPNTTQPDLHNGTHTNNETEEPKQTGKLGENNITPQNSQITETETNTMIQEGGNIITSTDTIIEYNADQMDIAVTQTQNEDTEMTPQQRETEKNAPVTPEDIHGETTTTTHPTKVEEEGAYRRREDNNNTRTITGSTGKKDPLTRSQEDFPILIAPTDEDLESTRPHYIRKRKPRTDAETSEERKGGRTMRSKKLST